MPVLGKEIERQYVQDEVSIKEVENYVERVERQTERHDPDQQNQGQPSTSDLAKVASLPLTPPSSSIIPKTPITLPLDQDEITTGMKGSVFDGVKWLAEWCIMMIKKYPGRVFYSAPNHPQ